MEKAYRITIESKTKKKKADSTAETSTSEDAEVDVVETSSEWAKTLAKGWAAVGLANKIAQPVIARVGYETGSTLLQTKISEGINYGLKAGALVVSIATGNVFGAVASIGWTAYDLINRGIDYGIAKETESFQREISLSRVGPSNNRYRSGQRN